MKVNFQTGEICASGLDVYVSGFVPIEVTRQYSSFRERAGSFGSRWSCSLDIELLPAETGWIYRDESGEILPATAILGSRDPWNLAAEELPLYEQPSRDEIILYTASRQKILFRSVQGRYRPQRVEDRHHNGISFDYAQNQLLTVRDDFGRELRVAYNSAGLISQLTLAWNVRGAEQVIEARYEYDIHFALVLVMDALENRWTYQYDGPLMISARNPKGGTEYATYDSQQRCIATWRSDGSRFRRLRYDTVRHTTVVQNALGHQWLYYYDEKGQMIERRDPLGGVRQTHYDLTGGVLAHTGADADGMSVVKKDGNRTEVTHANGASTVVVSSPNALPLNMIDACGNQWTWQYDVRGEVAQKVSPSGAITKYRHDRGFLEAMEFPNGATLRQTLDRRDGTIKIWDSVGAIGTLEFNLRGQLCAITDGAQRRVLMRRDTAGRVCQVTDENHWNLYYTHDPLGNVTAIERSDGSLDVYEYDEFGRLIRHTDALGGETRLNQGQEDRLLNLRLPNGRLHEFQYDPLDRVIGQHFTDGRRESYHYDSQGELAEIAIDSGVQTRLEYDPVGLITQKQTAANGELHFTYDPLRRLIDYNETNASATFEYDSDGNLTAESQNGRCIGLLYDAAGDCIGWRPDKAPAIDFEYDPRGRLTRLIDAEVGEFSFEYNAVDELTQVRYPDGSLLEYTYDTRGNIVLQDLIRLGNRAWNRVYSYDGLGRLVEAVSNGHTLRYLFDSADRLVAWEGDSRSESYGYDAAGDLTSIGPDAVKYDPSGKLRHCGDMSVEYDGRGYPDKLKWGEKIYELDWDGEGRLKQCVVDGTRTVDFALDMAARLLELTDSDGQRSFLWCGPLLHLEYKDQQLVQRYIYHPQLLWPLAEVSSSQPRFFVPDFKGQIAASFQETTSVTTYEYSPFGELRSTSDPQAPHPFRLPGQLALSELPFYYNRFRMYLPRVGRFLTPDPLGLMAGTNLYQYGMNPIHGVDLVGLCDGEVFYRAMSDAELQAVMKNCQLSNRPESESRCHEAFVTQRKDYSQKLQSRHPGNYPNLVEFCCSHGTAAAMQNPAISAASNSAAASRMFPNHSRVIKGLTNIIHLKFEQVGSRADQALNYGLRRGSIGTFNQRIKSAKAQPGGQSCSGPGK